ncbi:hypothetical protein DFJ74DRAFT_765028 [Hyaloraphidium curvatum]|nr:hypothetical protein DFJ74DRAFT_765028 [Hyaloraphidium curvatum]
MGLAAVASLVIAGVSLVAALSWFGAPKRFSLRGRVCVVSGGSSGIGKAAAAELVRRGAHVALLARRREPLDAAKKELEALGGKVSVHACDVTDEKAVDAAVEEIAGAHGAIDAVVANAGAAGPGLFLESTADKFVDLFRVNVVGVANLIRACVPHVPATGGRVVIVSSQAGAAGIYGYAAYSASKFALRGLFEVLSQELYNRNVLVSLCMPPNTDTPQLEEEKRSLPALTAVLTAATETVSADVVGRAIADGMEHWTPYIGIGVDGWFLNLATAGMGPAGSIWGAATQVLLGGLARLVAIGYGSYFYWVIRRKEGEIGKTDGKAGKAE